MILWLVEPEPFIGRTDAEIGEKLKNAHVPVILIVNKTDTAEKEIVQKTVETYREVMDFAKILTVSALRSVNVSKVRDAIFELLPEGPMYYDEDTVTDQPVRQIVAEIVREKALRNLKDEVPHGIAVTIDSMKQRKNGMWDIEAAITCERESHKGIIIGKNGAMIKSIGHDARIDAEDLLEDRVNLKLFVKVRKDWRDSDLMLKNFGYFENKDIGKDS